MGDSSEFFKARKAYDKEMKFIHRHEQMPKDIALVKKVSRSVIERNNGEHLIVTAWNGSEFDYWPSTKKWIRREDRRRGYSVETLVESINLMNLKKQ